MEVITKMGRKGEPNLNYLCPMCKRLYKRNPRCTRCGSESTFRFGPIMNSNGVMKQRYGCYSCNRTFRLSLEELYVILSD